MRSAARVLALVPLLLLASCASSPPAKFFTLAPLTASEAAGGAAPVTPVQVSAVHIPPALDRQEIVRQSGPNELEISDRNRWAAPFAEMTQRVLTQDLAARRPPGSVILPKEPVPPKTGMIVVDILQFACEPSGTVVFDGAWALVPAGADAPSLSRRVHLTESANPGDYGDQVRAMSVILGRIADDMAMALAAPGAGTVAR
ncbi:MAG TPA: PqiC family protein [Steroidobacteraceae bacterium]|nr:PqiC family protein [Steroidobacteraceae bacterium]